jgi:hypothetical protein
MRQSAREFQGDEEITRLQFEAANARAQAGAVRTAGFIGAGAQALSGIGGVLGQDPGTSLTQNAFATQQAAPIAAPVPTPRPVTSQKAWSPSITDLTSVWT